MLAKARLLIAEPEQEQREQLKRFFEMNGEIELCGMAGDGEEALALILQRKPDIVLLDLLMPRLDGISVLEGLRESPLPHFPHVIVTADFGVKSVIIARAFILGASYYVIKPYKMEDLLNRVLLFAKPSLLSDRSPGDVHSRLKRTVLGLGVSPNVLGFPYIIEATEVLLEQGAHSSLTKVVYPEVARRNNTTPDCVESAVRKAITKIYERDSEGLLSLMGQGMGGKRPSNGEFLRTLMEKIRDGSL